MLRDDRRPSCVSGNRCDNSGPNRQNNGPENRGHQQNHLAPRAQSHAARSGNCQIMLRGTSPLRIVISA